MKTSLAALTFLLISTVPAAGQDTNSDGRVSYLVPIISERPILGLNGSVWTTELWLHTDVQTRLRGCGTLIPPNGCPPHAAGITERAFDGEVVGFGTALVYDIPAGAARGLKLSSRLYESHGGQPVGVDIPVVREDKYFTSSARFVGVPSSSRTRVALRLYDPRRVPGLTVRVELLDTHDSLIAATVVSLTYQSFGEYGEPGFAAVFDLAASFPQLLAYDRFDVRVTSLRPRSEYWALVSVTDNESQQVVLVTDDANNTPSATQPAGNN
jgi:hypothetical protein